MDYNLLDDQIKANIADQRKQALQAEHYGIELRIKELEAMGDPSSTGQQVDQLRQSQAVLEQAYAVHGASPVNSDGTIEASASA